MQVYYLIRRKDLQAIKTSSLEDRATLLSNDFIQVTAIEFEMIEVEFNCKRKVRNTKVKERYNSIKSTTNKPRKPRGK